MLMDGGFRGTDQRLLPRAVVKVLMALTWMSLLPFTAPAAAQPTTSEPDKASATAQAPAAQQPSTDRYRDGMVIWETPSDAKVPFLLKFNINTQLRYLNTQNSAETFTDHLGVSREVHTRNDITVNREIGRASCRERV